jgi:hypothetical protein
MEGSCGLSEEGRGMTNNEGISGKRMWFIGKAASVGFMVPMFLFGAALPVALAISATVTTAAVGLAVVDKASEVKQKLFGKK